MNTEVFDLGKIGITLGGEYDNKVVYEKLTIVLYKGKSYISTKITQGVSPEQDILVWQLVAEAKDAYDMLVAEGKTTLTKEEFLEQLVDATKGRYVIQGNLVNAADEEDLTVEHSDLLGIDTLKFKNKEYNPSTYSGFGRKYLRKNMIKGVNTLTQSMINQSDTIYIIQYDFILGENIIIPRNCILEFDGGSISGAFTVTSNNTGINAGLVKIFNTNVILSGIWNVAEAYPEWFGAKGDGMADDANAIITCCSSFSYISLVQNYYISKTIDIPIGRVIVSKKFASNDYKNNPTFIVSDNINYGLIINSNCSLFNISIRKETYNINQTEYNINSIGIKLKGNKIKLEKVYVGWFDIGIETNAFLSNISLCICYECGIGFYLHGVSDDFPVINTDIMNENTSITLNNCYAMTCCWNGYYIKYLTYSTFISCAADGCGVSSVQSVTNIRWAYHVFGGKNLSFISCGCEICPKFMYIHNIVNVDIVTPNIIIGFPYSGQDVTTPVTNIIRIYGAYNIDIKNVYFDKIPGNIITYDNTKIIGYAGLSNYKYGVLSLTLGVIDIDNIDIENDFYKTQVSFLYHYRDRGNSSQRPTLKNVDIGYCYFDNELMKPIYWNSTAWIDATGTPV